jgi:predicted ATP-grasp superfamily ATP-dependent carboligase
VSRVLITDGEQRSALAIVRSLGRAGHTPFVASADGCSLAGGSRHAEGEAAVSDPLLDPPGFVEGLSGLVRRWNIDVLLPVTDAACLAILPRRSSLGDVCLPLPDEAAYRGISDKRLVLERAGEFGIAIPEQRVLKSPRENPEPAATLGYPLIVKPTRSVSETSAGTLTKAGVRQAADEEALRAVLSAVPPSAYPVLLQRRIDGPGVGVFLLLWEGEVLAAFSHRRIREKPPSGGVSVYRESIPLDADLVARSAALLNCFGWRGVAMIEYKLERDTGRPYLMEVNGRFWGSLQLAIDSGVDFPTLLIDVATGRSRSAPPGAYRVGVRSRWWWGDVDHLISRLRHSADRLGLDSAAPTRAMALVDFLKLWRPGDRSEVLRAGDLRPFIRETKAWLRGR